MNNTTTRNPDARLTPLTGAQYGEVDGWRRQHEPATCPCCQTATTQGWLDDTGCCYHCATEFDRPTPRIPDHAPLDIRLVTRNGRYFLTW